jgi:hypothetical protein
MNQRFLAQEAEKSRARWAVLEGDKLHGMIFFHQGDESAFVVK